MSKRRRLHPFEIEEAARLVTAARSPEGWPSEKDIAQTICAADGADHPEDYIGHAREIIRLFERFTAAAAPARSSPEGWPSEEQMTLRDITEWWDRLPGTLRQDIEGSGNEPGCIARARRLAAASAAPASGAEVRDMTAAERAEMETATRELDAEIAEILREAPSPSPPGWEEAREALEAAQTALSDWLVTYAEDCCSEEACEETRKRISELGTLGYITSVQETISAALRSLPAPSPSRKEEAMREALERLLEAVEHPGADAIHVREAAHQARAALAGKG